MKRVFVAIYGTLRTGQCNHQVMIQSEGVSLGMGYTVENYDIFDYQRQSYPAVSLTRKQSGTAVRVEVFEIPAEEYGYHREFLLIGTDSLEGYVDHAEDHDFYDRSLVSVKMDSGEQVDAYIYHIEKNEVKATIRIASGDWVAFKENGWAN